MDPDGSSRGRRFWGGLSVLLLAAAVTRFYHLGSWPLFGDEFYTLRDSTDFSFTLFGRPLLFWLNHNLVAPFLPLDEFGLRVLPAVFGVAGVGVVGVMGRKLIDGWVGLTAAALTVVSPWHLAMSQFARYYSLVFLLAAITPAALYLGVREKSHAWIAVGGSALLLAWFAHPTAVLPTAGFLVWLVGYGVLRTEGKTRRLLLAGTAGVGVVGVVAGIALLSQWTAMEQSWGIGGLQLLASYGVRLSAGPALAAAVGVSLLWLDDREQLASFLAAAAAVPIALVAVLGKFAAVHTGYLFATVPYALVAAAAFLVGTVRRLRGRGVRLLAAGSLLGLLAATGLPSFVSHYVDGGKADFRSAARHVAERAGPGDVVLTDQPAAFRHYAPELDARPLARETSRLDSLSSTASAAVPDASVWVVPYIHSEGGFGLEGLGPARRWVWQNCRLVLRDIPVRIDHVRNFVEVWRCSTPPETGPRSIETRPRKRSTGPDNRERQSSGPRHLAATLLLPLSLPNPSVGCPAASAGGSGARLLLTAYDAVAPWRVKELRRSRNIYLHRAFGKILSHLYTKVYEMARFS